MTASVPSLAGALQGARRDRGLTQAELAREAGLPEATVRAAEEGVTVGAVASRDLCVALGVDPAPHVPGLGTLRPPSLDEAHARVVDYLEDLACREGVTLALPDVVAMTARQGVPDAERRVIEAGARRWSVPQGLVASGLCGFLCTMGLGLVSAVDLRNGFGPEVIGPMTLLIGLCGSMGVTVSGVFLDGTRLGDTGPRARKRGLDSWTETRDDLAVTGYVVAPDSLVVLRVAHGELRRRELLASSFTSVRVTDEDADHVTVEVDGILGKVTMSWLPRTRDLVDAVAAWSARGGRQRLEGPQ